jgi:hypothetical protein
MLAQSRRAFGFSEALFLKWQLVASWQTRHHENHEGKPRPMAEVWV